MKEKLKSFGVPLLIMLLLVGALFIHQLMEVKKQPQPDWSRSVPLGFTSEERPQAFFNKDTLFLTGNGKVHGLKFDEQLNLQEDSAVNTKITRGNPFWTDGSVFIQKKSDLLVAMENNKDTVIMEKVDGISTGKERVYFWSKNELFSLNPADLSYSKIHTFPKDIMEVYQGDNGSAIVQVHQNDANGFLHYMDENEQIVGDPFALVKISTNQHIDGLTYGVKDDKLTILYNEQMRAQGTLSYKILKLQAPIGEIGTKTLKPETLSFLNVDSGEKLQGPRSAKLVTIEGKPSVLFTSEGHKASDQNSVRVYLAPLEDESQLDAKTIGTTKHYSYLPFQLNSNSIAWLDYGGDTYELFGASKDPKMISASVELKKRSVKEAVNNTVMMIFSSVITILISFYWVLPSLFLLIVLYMIKPNIFEKDGINWVEYASILIFMIMPLTFMGKALNGYFYFAAPEYLTFTGSGYVGVIVISLLTALIWKFGRNPDWGTFGGVFYFMGVYILIYVSSFGPYVFNLF